MGHATNGAGARGHDSVESGAAATDVDLTTVLGAHRLASPLIAASGCAGFGHELVRWGGLSAFGALVTPSLTHEPQEAIDERVLVESPAGLVHPHDTPNVGASTLNATRLPWEVAGETPVIASIAGATSGDFADAAAAVRRRTAMRGLVGVEVNLSVANEANSGRPFAGDEYAVTKVIARVREHLPRNVLLAAKLTTGTDVVELSRACLKSGADAIVLGSPPSALSIDTATLRPRMRWRAAMAGPALLPLTVGAVFEVKAAMNAGRLPQAPLVASGGIAGLDAVVQALAAGASAVQVGSALFRDPRVGVTLRASLASFLVDRGLSVAQLVGAAHA